MHLNQISFNSQVVGSKLFERKIQTTYRISITTIVVDNRLFKLFECEGLAGVFPTVHPFFQFNKKKLPDEVTILRSP